MSDAVQTPGLLRNQSLRRAVAILRALSERPRSSSTSEIASAVDLPRATAARLLATLADAGLAERLQTTDGWVLGYEAIRLGRAADPYAVLKRRALPSLEELTAATGESSVLAVTRFPAEVEIVAQVNAPNLLGVTDWVGRTFGLHASVSGKLAYARLPERVRDDLLNPYRFTAYTPNTITERGRFEQELALIRRRGYATSVDELELGLTLLGMDIPPRQADALIVASVGIMGPTSRISPGYASELRAIRRCVGQVAELDW